MSTTSQTKSCQNCNQNFTIEPEDFSFYEKIKVPPPTWCPECRFIRRYLWRNERSLYKRKSDVPGVDEYIISMYSPDKDYIVYDEKYWWSDSWDPIQYGVEYDFSRPFFQQYGDLLKRIPLINLSVTNNVNSSYCNISAQDKGCYMISACGLDENVMYSNRLANTKDSMDVYISDKNLMCYELIDSSNSFKVLFSNKANNCVDSYFLYDCVNCQNCFGCVGLRNKSYHIFNKPYSRELYFEKIKEFNLGSHESISKLKDEFREFVKIFPKRFANNINCVNSTGDNIRNSKNAQFCFDAEGVEDGKFFTWVYMGLKDCYDVGAGSGVNIERVYESWDTNFSSQNVLFSSVIYACYDIQYSWNCHGSHNLFGCYGLRNKEYCILNKQYTKEEYHLLVAKIIKHMNDMPFFGQGKRVYKYGEFFPVEISPFSYNETIAQEYFPITKEEAYNKNYNWRDITRREYVVTLASKELPDSIHNAEESITRQVIGCEHSEIKNHFYNCDSSCTTAFRITNAEFSFYKRMGVPLPRVCPNCRHYRRLRERNPIKLWHRSCMCEKENHTHNGKCQNEFETSYSPDRPEMVYCEKCYQQEIY